MKHLIHDYRNIPGEHCGSTAMRNLLFHYCGLELSEAMVFGLGSGADFLFIRQEEQEPSVLLFGRGLTMEVDIGLALGVDYREQPELDDEQAWQRVRDEVAQGRPTMLSGDALYLTYRDFKVHFPAHRFVLVGFDDETGTAQIADRMDEAIQPCPYEALRQSRNPVDFISTYNLWGKFHGTQATHTLEEACAAALTKSADRMLGRDSTQLNLLTALSAGRLFEASIGLPGMREFREHLPKLTDHQDWRFICSYSASAIEKFGTGGGNFRLLYAGFLEEARGLLPDRIDADFPELARRSAAAWTELGGRFNNLGKGQVSEPADELQACVENMSTIIEAETELFTRIDEQREGGFQDSQEVR